MRLLRGPRISMSLHKSRHVFMYLAPRPAHSCESELVLAPWTAQPSANCLIGALDNSVVSKRHESPFS